MRDAVQIIMEHNDPRYNYIKLAEELAELSEVVIKSYVKGEKYDPGKERLIEEAGDVLLRLKILSRQEGIAQLINDRIKFKSDKLLMYIDTKQFKEV